MLTEVTAVPTAALPVFQFRDHLRLGTGFADDGLEDGLLETYLRAAIAAVEAWTGKALVERAFSLEIAAWSGAAAHALPVAPVRLIDGLTLVDAAGGERAVGPERLRLEPDTHVPRLAGTGGSLPTIPAGGRARLAFAAGFGPAWGDVPADLAHAVLMLAAYYWEYRHEARSGAERIPYGVSRLIASWRVMRVHGRGGR